MSTLNDKTLEQYIKDYAKAHTGGDVQEAMSHQVVKNVIAMYKERERSRSGQKEDKGRPVNMHGRCDS